MLDDLTAKFLGIDLGYSQGLEYKLNDDQTLLNLMLSDDAIP